MRGFLTVALALASLTSAEVPGGLKTRISVASHDKHVVCYWGTWSTYRKSKGQFTVNNLDPGTFYANNQRQILVILLKFLLFV